MSIFKRKQKSAGQKLLAEAAPDNTGTRITPGMKIRGDIEAHGDYVVADGPVYGDVSSESTVSASSFVRGNIRAAAAVLNGAKVRGNVDAAASVNISEGSIVNGNVSSAYASVKGKINGSVRIDGDLDLAETTLIRGNVSAKDLTAPHGSRILGNVSVFSGSTNNDFDDEFYFNEYETEDAEDGSDH